MIPKFILVPTTLLEQEDVRLDQSQVVKSSRNYKDKYLQLKYKEKKNKIKKTKDTAKNISRKPS